MNELEKARLSIDETDREIVKLFEKRMIISKQIAIYKKENGMDIQSSAREEEVIRNNLNLIENEEIKKYYPELIKTLIGISKEYQNDIINGK